MKYLTILNIVIMLAVSGSGTAYATDYDTSYNLILNGGAETGNFGGYNSDVTVNFSINTADSNSGSNSFQADCDSGTVSELSSLSTSVEPNEPLLLTFSYKVVAGSSIDTADSYVAVRFFAADNTLIAQNSVSLSDTLDQWVSETLEVGDPNSQISKADVYIRCKGTALTVVRIDDIALHAKKFFDLSNNWWLNGDVEMGDMSGWADNPSLALRWFTPINTDNHVPGGGTWCLKGTVGDLGSNIREQTHLAAGVLIDERVLFHLAIKTEPGANIDYDPEVTRIEFRFFSLYGMWLGSYRVDFFDTNGKWVDYWVRDRSRTDPQFGIYPSWCDIYVRVQNTFGETQDQTVYIDGAGLYRQAYADPNPASMVSTRNLWLNGDVEDGNNYYNTETNFTIDATDSATAGSHCWRADVNSSDVSELAHDGIPARPGELVQFKYYIKSNAGAAIDHTLSWVEMRAFDDNNPPNILGVFYRKSIGEGDGSWNQFSDVVRVYNHPNVATIDFALRGTGDGGNDNYKVDGFELYKAMTWIPTDMNALKDFTDQWLDSEPHPNPPDSDCQFWDRNGDCTVDFIDYSAFSAGWQK